MYFVSDLFFPSKNKINRCFRQGETDESTFIKWSWPIDQLNKHSFSACKQAIAIMSNNNRSLQQSVRWAHLQNSNRKASTRENVGHAVIYITVTVSENRCYSVGTRRSSHGYTKSSASKRCTFNRGACRHCTLRMHVGIIMSLHFARHTTSFYGNYSWQMM